LVDRGGWERLLARLGVDRPSADRVDLQVAPKGVGSLKTR